MPVLDLSIDALLTTTRSVRRRLDLSRPVEPAMPSLSTWQTLENCSMHKLKHLFPRH
jgi:hypothetical protein